ncbi:MAG: hypothetical protein JXP34_28205 [Planctomycetes bacterium]|nr:hypothetical protein [Planctomycetota bacterium]
MSGTCTRRTNPFRLGWIAAVIAVAMPATTTAADDPMVRISAIEPTVFFVRERGALRQRARLVIENASDEIDVGVEIAAGSERSVVNLGPAARGESAFEVSVPALSASTPIEFSLTARGKARDRRVVDWSPGRRWRVFFVPITHHDLGYTDTIENVLDTYAGFYDDVLRFCEETEDWPEESKYRYTGEGAWSLQYFVRHRPEEAIRKLKKYVEEGRVEIPALYANEITGLCSHEGLIRLLYPSRALKHRLGGCTLVGSITDVPGLSWGLPTVLAGAGAKYFFAGLPTYFQWGRSDVHDFWDASAILRHGRPDAFRWEGPDGGSVLVYYQGGYGFLRGATGPNSFEEVLEHLPGQLRDMERRDSAFDVARFIHNGVDNYPPDIEISRIARRWNERWAFPELIVSTNAMFFEALEKQSSGVRVFRGELPHTDYAVGATSTAEETCVNRVTHERLPAAEKYATIASLLADYPRPPAEGQWVRNLSSYENPTRKISEAYDNMLLYDEHTWGMAHPAGVRHDWNWSDKSHFARKAAGLADSILSGSISAIADRIRLSDSGRHIVVFNPLSFPRTDIVRVAVSRDDGPIELVDVATGGKVTGQIERIDDPLAPLPYAAHRYGRGQFHPPEALDLLFVAEDVPPLGWKTYRVVPAATEAPAGSSLRVERDALENRFFRVRLDPATGTIRSIYDKELDRELVDGKAPHRVNQLVVRRVATGTLESATAAAIEKGSEGPVLASLRVTSRAPGCPQVIQDIALYDRIKRIDLANRILKDSTPLMELHFAFPFDVEDPAFRFEASNSVIEPLRDQFPGSNSNYYSVQHWADVGDGTFGITLAPIDSHLVEFGGLWPCYVSQAHHGVTPPDFGRPFVTAEDLTRGHLYAFVLSTNFRTNFPTAQRGDLLFRYALGTHRGDWRSGAPRDLGWAACNPLVALEVDGPREGSLAPQAGFCRVDGTGVLLSTLKRAEDGPGIILRLIETEGREAKAAIELPLVTIAKAYRTNLIEENQGEMPSGAHEIVVPVTPFGIATVRLLLE